MSRALPLCCLTVLSLLCGCSALTQTSEEVTLREPGHRLLGKPLPIATEAKKHWQFAWLAEASYRKTPAGERAELSENTGECEYADVVLEKHGWTRWKTFPDDILLSEIQKSHLRVEVWENRPLKFLVVTFGGTVFKNRQDWRANLRWFFPGHKDQYSAVVDHFGPKFIEEFVRRIQQPENFYLKELTLVSTGHSLGGGLAQQFAYSLPLNDLGLRIKHVYAFDPSPVTGFFSVDTATRDANRKGLLIDRIYERGEIVALLRSFTSIFLAPSEVDPSIRGVRYSVFRTLNPVADHSMQKLACGLQRAAQSELKNERIQ